MNPEIKSNEGQIEVAISLEGTNSSLEEKVSADTASFPQIVELHEGEEHETISPELVERRARTVRNLDKYISSNRISGRARILRDKQMAVFVDTRNFINDGNTEGFVEAPTGFGKTVLFSEFIKATNEKTVIAVPSRLLVEQTYARLRQFNPNIDIGRFYSDVKERGRQITVTTYQSLALSNGGVNPEEVDLLILDEVHQSLTDIRIEAANRFTRSIKLGFTATPEFTEDKRVQNLLNNEIHTITLKEAVETGLLSSFSVYLAETDVDLSNIKVTHGGEYDPRELEEAVNIYSRNKSAVELYKQLIEQNPDLAKAVSYCVSIKHAREVAALFNAEGIPAGAVWSDQDPHERKEVMDAYRKGEIKVLTNVNILTEGFDDPESALCLNLRPTLSRVVAKQRGGRVLRLDPTNPKKHAIIVDYLDRNENKRNVQVTFAQVAEGAQIQNQTTIDTRTGLVKPGGGNGGATGCIDIVQPFNIDGLNVITNAEEVLRIVREELEQEMLPDIQESELPITNKSMLSLFVGNIYIIRPALSNTLEYINSEYPNLIQKRRSGVHIVDVATNKQLFISLMVSNGARLFDSGLENVKAEEFVINDRYLESVFVGEAHNLMPHALEVLSEILETNPDKVARRKRKGHSGPVFVITDKNLLIEKMSKRGVMLKKDKELLPDFVEGEDFALTKSQLMLTFRGDFKKLQLIVGDVIEELKKENPGVIVKKVRRELTINVPTNVELFIQMMVEKGARLKITNDN